MIFFTGGKFEGAEEYIEKNFEGRKQIMDFEESIKKNIDGLPFDNAVKEAENLAESISRENKDAVIFLPEVGCGIIPIDEKERIFREALGRAGCILSENADEVFLVTMGIGQKIKGD